MEGNTQFNYQGIFIREPYNPQGKEKEEKRMYTIQELRAMHKLSKPELKKAMEKSKIVARTDATSREAQHVIGVLVQACESYDEVIDQLFDEIDRLNGMKVQ